MLVAVVELVVMIGALEAAKLLADMDVLGLVESLVADSTSCLRSGSIPCVVYEPDS